MNAASNLPGPLAAFTFASIYGERLAFTTHTRDGYDVVPGIGGVDVIVNGQLSVVSYVSPLQVNFLVPWGISPPKATFQLVREGTAGPAVELDMDDAAPALFQLDVINVVAAHAATWEVVTAGLPARPGEYIILYATGLGPYVQPLDEAEIPRTADPISRRGEFQLLLDGAPVADANVAYVGAAPLFIAVYQINLLVPALARPNPEIRIALGDFISPPNIHLLATP